MDQWKWYLVTVIIYFCFVTVNSQLVETSHSTVVQCYGSFINATCPALESLALNNIQVGMRPTSHGCHGNETAGDGTGCCVSANDACEFEYPIDNNKLYHMQCNGLQGCNPRAERIGSVHGSCNSTIYPSITEYMFFNFFCVEDARIGDTASSQLSAENAALYLHNPGYPTGNITSAVTEHTCSVETDNCMAVLNVYVIERNLADYVNSSLCNQMQSLSIADADGTVLVNWTCSDNTYDVTQALTSTENYVTVTLTNTMATDGGKFWIGFAASLSANLTIACPATPQQYCATTTSTTTTTTTTSPTTTTDTTTTTATTTPTTTTDTTTTATTTTTEVTTTSTEPTTSTIFTSTTTVPTTTTSSNLTTEVLTGASKSSTTDFTMIIVASSSVGVVLLITLIIGLIICFRPKKQKSSSDEERILDKADPKEEPSTRSSSPDLDSSDSNDTSVALTANEYEHIEETKPVNNTETITEIPEPAPDDEPNEPEPIQVTGDVTEEINNNDEPDRDTISSDRDDIANDEIGNEDIDNDSEHVVPEPEVPIEMTNPPIELDDGEIPQTETEEPTDQTAVHETEYQPNMNTDDEKFEPKNEIDTTENPPVYVHDAIDKDMLQQNIVDNNENFVEDGLSVKSDILPSGTVAVAPAVDRSIVERPPSEDSGRATSLSLDSEEHPNFESEPTMDTIELGVKSSTPVQSEPIDHSKKIEEKEKSEKKPAWTEYQIDDKQQAGQGITSISDNVTYQNDVTSGKRPLQNETTNKTEVPAYTVTVNVKPKKPKRKRRHKREHHEDNNNSDEKQKTTDTNDVQSPTNTGAKTDDALPAVMREVEPSFDITERPSDKLEEEPADKKRNSRKVRQKKDETPYERNYRGIAQSFYSAEILDKKIVKRLQASKKKHRIKRKRSSVAPADTEQRSS